MATQEARSLGIPGPTPFDVDGWALADARVITERQLGTGRGRIDILVVDTDDGFVCLIENKIGANEHSGQLGRYLDTVEREFNGLTPFPVFLTPEGVRPEKEKDAERYVPIGYGAISELVERVLETRHTTISHSVYTFLDQYRRTLGRHIVSTPDNIDELAFRIYANNRAAIDRIIRAKDLPGDLDMDRVEDAIARFAPDLKPDTHTENIRRYFVPQLEEIAELKHGDGWTDSKRMVLIEFGYNAAKRNLLLATTIGPGEEIIRNRLITRARRGGLPFRKFQIPPALRSSWTHVYRKNLLSARTYDPFKLDEAQQHLERGIADFYRKDYFPIVNAIRAEFGLQPVSAS